MGRIDKENRVLSSLRFRQSRFKFLVEIDGLLLG